MNTRRSRAIARPTSRRAKRGQDDIRKGAPLIVIAVLLLAGLIGAYAYVARSRADLDPETGCPRSGPSAITAILFDRTDPINEKQRLYLTNKLDSFRERTQKFEEVDTYSLEDQRDNVVTPLLRVCDPGRGTDVSSITGNPKLLSERWEKHPSEKCWRADCKAAEQRVPLSSRLSSQFLYSPFRRPSSQ